MKKCPNCGNEVENEKVFCDKCGSSIETLKNNDIKTGIKIPKWLIIVVIFIAIIGIVANLGDDKEHQNKTEEDNTSKNKVKVINFKAMDKDLVTAECNILKLNCSIIEEYSDTEKKGEVFKQSVDPETEIYEGDTIKVYISLGKEPTMGQKNALKTAESYLRSSAFSRKGLIEQLKYEEYSTEEATYAVDNIDVDWNEQAAKCAESYLKSSSFSRKGLIDQLKYEGFTTAQAEYGVSQNGY